MNIVKRELGFFGTVLSLGGLVVRDGGQRMRKGCQIRCSGRGEGGGGI